MIPVFSREESRAFDEAAIGTLRAPSVVLMENAGRGVVDAIERHWPSRSLRSESVVVVCGTGNNGGDGFVVARHLHVRGASLKVFVVGDVAKIAGDACIHLAAMTGLGIVHEVIGEGTVSLEAALGRATLVVDALFGTGLSRDVGGAHAAAIEAIARSGRPVVAIDVPSGLDANTGATLGHAVPAQLTVTFVTQKLGLLTPRGSKLAGEVVVADIGVPAPRAGASSAARLLERADVLGSLHPRSSDAHKNGAGHVVVFAGSPGHLGAAVMCAHGAFRAGAGLVTIATWPVVADALDVRIVEVMTRRLDPQDLAGSVDAAIERADVVVVGPGFGKDEHARTVLHRILDTWDGPCVVDADAIAMCAGTPERFASARGTPILTPHPGELGVLLGTNAREIESDRFASHARGVERTGSVLLLKGAHTIVGAPGVCPVVNASGTSALATAGSGDILSGTIGALACTLEPLEAAFVGAYLHGLAAETWSKTHAQGDRGLLAHEIADQYPALLGELVASSR